MSGGALTFDPMLAAFGADPLLLLLLALVIDAFGGGLSRLLRPLRRTILAIERRLNRERRGEATRLVRGAVLVAVLVGLAASLGGVADALAGRLPFGWIAVLLLLLTALDPRPAADRAGRAAALAGWSGEAHAADRHAQAREAVEGLAEGLGGGLVGGVFWYVLLGLPGLLAYRAADLLNDTLGEDLPRLAAFGLTARRFHAALALLPGAIAAGLLVTAAATVPGANPLRALAVARAQGGKGSRLGSAWPRAAVAGALGLALGAPPPAAAGTWIGPASGRARVEREDVRRALFLYLVACLLALALIALIAMARFAP